MKSTSRCYEALTGKDESSLTPKQYLVYAYLMSISIWNAEEKESHYYVYKNEFKVKEVAELLGISENTWRSSLRELRKQNYIYYPCDKEEIEKETYKEAKGNRYYIIYLPRTFVPLDINLIKELIKYGTKIEGAGNIVSVYSMIYKYWYYCQQRNKPCELTVTQIARVFTVKKDACVLRTYRLMIAAFEILKLAEIKEVKRTNKGKDYIAYVISNPSLKLVEKYDYNNEPEIADDILKALEYKIDC